MRQSAELMEWCIIQSAFQFLRINYNKGQNQTLGVWKTNKKPLLYLDYNFPSKYLIHESATLFLVLCIYMKYTTLSDTVFK